VVFNYSRVNRVIHISENLVGSLVKDTFRCVSLVHLLQCRFIHYYSSWDPGLILGIIMETSLFVSDRFISVVNSNDFIRLVDSLRWRSTPAIENWYFLSHVLAWFGATECKLVFIHTLARQDPGLLCLNYGLSNRLLNILRLR